MILLELYTKVDCPNCDQVKKLLYDNCVPFNEYGIGWNITRYEVLGKFPEAKVVPIIIFNGQRLGGIAELTKIVEQGLI